MQPSKVPNIPIAQQCVQSASKEESRHVFLLTVAFFAGLSIILTVPIFSSSSWLVYVQDDLLYYLKVAQSISSAHHSTFNDIVLTNGYQPLWLICLVALSWATRAPRLILTFLACSNFLAALATFCLARRLLRICGAGPILVFICSAWTTLYAVTLFFYGMEVTLTVPLMLSVLCLLQNVRWLTRNWVNAFLFGLLLSAMVLSRVDTLIFGGLLLYGIVASQTLRRLIRMDLVLGLLVGLLPIALYFLFNHVVFDTWLPVSGMAKELRQSHHPSIEPWKVFFHPLAAIFTSLIVSAMVVLAVIRKRFDPITRIMFFAALIFPFTYYLILSCLSDWTLWGWYIYPIRIAVCVSFVIWLSLKPVRDLLQQPIVRWVLVASVFLCLALLRWTKQQTDIYEASVDVQHFAQSHPGIYAMGDRAGRVAYLIPDPVVQTEGLMMDRDYLRFIERETPLREMLAHYHVRYYVATAYEPFSGCFKAVEPAKAGPDSKKMTAVFCEEPVARYMHEGIQTLVYKMEQR